MIKKYFFIILLLWSFNNTLAQQTFRRHFIIAYDVSTPFVHAVNATPAYHQALVNLFSNKLVYRYSEAYQDNLYVERRNGLPFFDPDRDEISLFHFNIAASEFDRLRRISNADENEIVSTFNNLFLKDKNFNWTNFPGGSDLSGYVLHMLSIPPTPSRFGNGVSMSNFVYPLVLDQIDPDKYAEEYVLIILSDFLTGSTFGNTKDLDRVRDIFKIPYGVSLSGDSPVSYIKKQIDDLASQFYKIDFFQYAFLPPRSNNLIGIIAYKVKPKVGVLTPEDISLFVDGDLDLQQRGYQSQRFKTSETRIKFTHNENLEIHELKMSVSSQLNGEKKVLFEDVVASKDETGAWTSRFTKNKQLMRFDESQHAYFLPSFKISLDQKINQRNFRNLVFQYEFKTKYTATNNQPLNFIYKTERVLPVDNINYSTKASVIIMFYLIPILAVLLLLYFMVKYGKPEKLLLRIDGYLDSFEYIDYKTSGKLLTPFKAWDRNQHAVDYLLVDGEIKHKSDSYLFNWNSPVYLRLQQVSVPDGFELFLKPNTDDLKEFGSDNVLSVRKRNNKISFVVGIRQNDITKVLVDPELVKFTVEAVIKDAVFFIKSEIHERLEYKFHMGVDLQDAWVGFDPGTTGSCVAVGSATDNIILGEDKARNNIIPSILVFDKSEPFQENGVEIPEQIYKHGSAAAVFYQSPGKYKGFQSIKKLLGYKDIKEVVFENSKTLHLRGKDLAGLLVKGLFKDMETFFNRSDINPENYNRDGAFNPLRAVVAIPNNFTITKIQDMVDCIDNLNQFKEIRYVYEAEAVLFYYLSNFSELSKGETPSNSETLLVFDMGGATINATVVTTNKTLVNERPKYDIDFLGKIGFGIGGDTIDYCISRFILSFSDEFPMLSSIHILENKIPLALLAFKIKMEIIANYYTDKDYLITAYNLEKFINEELGTTITIDQDTSEMYSYFKKESGKFRLFDHPLFVKIIYDNVKDAIHEVIRLSGTPQINKVIFSGRSTSFPLIKETVEKQLKTYESKPRIIALSLEESKTAVAKGACWYGINKNSVRLNNLKTNASFGFKKTLSADKMDVKYFELVEMGCTFDTHQEGIDAFHGVKNITDDFAFDGNKVHFYQVMGKDADKILSEGQKHKFSKIASVNLDQVTSKVAMKVNENDEVECAVVLQSNRKIIEMGVVSDQEIDEANEEHYTWTVK